MSIQDDVRRLEAMEYHNCLYYFDIPHTLQSINHTVSHPEGATIGTTIDTKVLKLSGNPEDEEREARTLNFGSLGSALVRRKIEQSSGKEFLHNLQQSYAEFDRKWDVPMKTTTTTQHPHSASPDSHLVGLTRLIVGPFLASQIMNPMLVENGRMYLLSLLQHTQHQSQPHSQSVHLPSISQGNPSLPFQYLPFSNLSGSIFTFNRSLATPTLTTTTSTVQQSVSSPSSAVNQSTSKRLTPVLSYLSLQQDSSLSSPSSSPAPPFHLNSLPCSHPTWWLPLLSSLGQADMLTSAQLSHPHTTNWKAHSKKGIREANDEGNTRYVNNRVSGDGGGDDDVCDREDDDGWRTTQGSQSKEVVKCTGRNKSKGEITVATEEGKDEDGDGDGGEGEGTVGGYVISSVYDRSDNKEFALQSVQWLACKIDILINRILNLTHDHHHHHHGEGIDSSSLSPQSQGASPGDQYMTMSMSYIVSLIDTLVSLGDALCLYITLAYKLPSSHSTYHPSQLSSSHIAHALSPAVSCYIWALYLLQAALSQPPVHHTTTTSPPLPPTSASEKETPSSLHRVVDIITCPTFAHSICSIIDQAFTQSSSSSASSSHSSSLFPSPLSPSYITDTLDSLSLLLFPSVLPLSSLSTSRGPKPASLLWQWLLVRLLLRYPLPLLPFTHNNYHNSDNNNSNSTNNNNETNAKKIVGNDGDKDGLQWTNNSAFNHNHGDDDANDDDGLRTNTDIDTITNIIRGLISPNPFLSLQHDKDRLHQQNQPDQAHHMRAMTHSTHTLHRSAMSYISLFLRRGDTIAFFDAAARAMRHIDTFLHSDVSLLHCHHEAFFSKLLQLPKPSSDNNGDNSRGDDGSNNANNSSHDNSKVDTDTNEWMMISDIWVLETIIYSLMNIQIKLKQSMSREASSSVHDGIGKADYDDIAAQDEGELYGDYEDIEDFINQRQRRKDEEHLTCHSLQGKEREREENDGGGVSVKTSITDENKNEARDGGDDGADDGDEMPCLEGGGEGWENLHNNTTNGGNVEGRRHGDGANDNGRVSLRTQEEEEHTIHQAILGGGLD